MARGKKNTNHVRLEREYLNSTAHLSLTPVARSLLLEFWNIAYPSRNGHLVMPTKRAAGRVNVSEPTIIKAFRELERTGFIVQTEAHRYSIGRAKSWRLTMVECDGKEPTNDWRDFEPDVRS